jgi:hypothetical protein
MDVTNLPNIILPGEPTIQRAVSRIKSNFPNFFDKIKEIRIAPGGSGYAYVTNTPKDMGIIFLDLNKIKTKLKGELGSASQEEIDKAIENALLEVISHEQGHIEDELKGGELPAEQRARDVVNVINACSLLYELTKNNLNLK